MTLNTPSDLRGALTALSDLRGVLTALSTPFDADENIDIDLLKKVVDRPIDNGVDGVVAGGSTGEFAMMSTEERLQLVDTVTEHTAGRVPVIAQTGATTTRQAIRFSKAAEKSGADVLILVTPYYEPLTLTETLDYIREVASSVEIPVMLYNIPGATGVNLSADNAGALADQFENIRYIKDSSANWEQALQLIHHHGDRLGTFIGWDSYIYSALLEGAAGVMAGAANVVPSEIVEVVRLINAGDAAAALDAASSDTATVVNPATGEVLANVARGTVEEVDAAVAAASTALTTWRETTPKDRAELLNKLADIVEENTDLLSRLESANGGTPKEVADDDVAGTVDVLRFSAGAARAYTELGAGDYVADHTSYGLREPLGVIGAVVPWNYPLLMGAWKFAPVLAAGNTLVLKPSEQTPLSMLKFIELIADVLPAGVFNVVTGKGSVVGNRLSQHPDVAMIALTGSVGSGRSVATVAGDSLKRVHLELGGKAPLVIFEDADLPAAAEAIREASYWNSGQECGAGTRVLIHESVAEEFTRLLVEQVSTFTVGDPAAGEDVEIGPLVSRGHFDRVVGFLDRAVAESATAAIGGSAIDGDGFFVEPTVLTGVGPGTEAASEEIFGPVVTVETFADEDEAIRRANETPYGLSASVWTTDAARSIDVPRKIDAGTVWVNCHLVPANEVPWGGFKGSGYGRDLSLYALQDYSRTKHVQINHARR